MENVGKIRQYITYLDSLEPRDQNGNVIQQWVPVQGYFATTGFNFGNQISGPNFNANFGYPVKLFYNTRTGEVKMFHATIFENQ